MTPLPGRAVVDASVAGKWFLPESDSLPAARLLAESELLAPALLYIEVGNTLWKQVTRAGMPYLEAEFSLRLLLRFEIALTDIEALAVTALEVACLTGRAIYDSFYVALALQEDVPLVTADERLYNAVASSPFASCVIQLSDLA